MDQKASQDFDQILDRARAGDEGAWAELYDSLAPQLLGYLRVRGADDPESLVGDVFLSVARGIVEFDGTASKFRSWVFVIATSRLIDERRRQRRRPTEPLDPLLEERLSCDDDVQAEVERAAASHAAAELLAVLTPDQRAVVSLRVFGGLTSAEVAEIVDKPLSAVKALYRRGLASLRRELVGDADVADRPRELLAAVSFGTVASVTGKP